MSIVTSAFQGITTPASDLYNQITNLGWTTTKVKYDSKLGAFTATGKNLHGEQITKTGPNESTALGNLLVAVMRHTHMRTAAQWKVSMWKTMFTDQLKPIAEAYSKAPVYDPKAAGCFQELAQDSVRRAEVLKQQLHIEVVNEPEPYPSAQAMADDIHKNRHFLVSRANCQHPVWSVEQNIAFRIVHDVLGHAVSGGDFGWQGENLACAAHFPLLTPTAQQALFTECIGQTAYAAYYRSFGPQKVALFPEFTDGAQAAEKTNALGVHPSQSVAPTSMPSVPASPPASGALPDGSIAPHQEALGLTPLMTPSVFGRRYASIFSDPNQGWDSQTAPMSMETHGVGNAYLDHGDPLDSQGVMDNARLIDTQWSQLKKGDGSLDRARAKQAICNAFRVVLLSPRKDLRWNAVHYQHINSIPADTDDPKQYWDTLEAHRRQWNKAQGFDENSHMIFWKYLKPFESIIYQMNPDLGFDGAKKKAERTIFQWWSEEQQRIETEDAEKPQAKQRSSDEIERRANEALAKRLDVFIKDKTNPKTDVAQHDAEPLRLFGAEGDNYVSQVRKRFDNVNFNDPQIKFKAGQIKEQLKKDSKGTLPDEKCDELMRLYAHLAVTKGKSTTLKDIHDAWAYWTIVDKNDAGHDSVKPFEDLTATIQQYDQPYRDAVVKIAAGGQYNVLTGQEANKYGAFMGTHLKAISQISQHADELLDAALQDVKEHDGSGHHFRAKTLSLDISGVGPKVCSFAWLLLQPMTSQLATIDTHMMDVLGHNYEKEMNNRDYFKFERELASGRDAAGYGHVPLGAFQWGMWDHKRTGPGSHQDHSAMRVLDPVPHDQIDWQAKVQPVGGGHAEAFKESWAANAPDWWKNTQAAREATGAQWDAEQGKQFPQGAIPYQMTADPTLAKVASGESLDEFHVGVTLPEELFPKLAEIGAKLELDEIEKPENYHVTYFWSDHGYDRKELHEWIRKASMPGQRFFNARVDSFPSQDGRFAIVLRLDAPEAKVLAETLMDEAEEHGLEIKRFEGGWKAHITLGWAQEKVKGNSYPEISFRAGALYVSVPRPLRNAGDFLDNNHVTAGLGDPAPWVNIDHGQPGGEQDVGAPGEGAMEFARLNYPTLSTPEIWKILGENGAGKLDASGKSYGTA